MNTISTMDYETFASDLILEECMSFRSAEESEEVMQSLGINQQVRQQGAGRFQAHMTARSTEKAEIFADRFNTGVSIYLEPPEGMTGFLFPRSASGQFLASGENVANDKLLIMPAGSYTDIAGPDLIGSEAIAISPALFTKLFESLCPTLKAVESLTAIEGNITQLHGYQQAILKLLRAPEHEPIEEQLSNLLTQVVEWVGYSSSGWRSESISAAPTRIHIAKLAQEYIEENHRAIFRMEDMCVLTGVGVRTSQRCFREYFDLTIGDYVKAVRLNSARRELKAASSSQSSVTDIALENGFTHLGRFSAEYRKMFCELPSETHAANGHYL
jgi:AraC family ethanolamine operon transcriptional activator